MNNPSFITSHSIDGDHPHVKLTDDVIHELYCILADIDPPRSPRLRSDSALWKGSLGWIRLTHVSRQWHCVGIGMPLLWARIICIFPPGIQEILDRSKDLPLTLCLSRTWWSCRDLLQLPLTRAREYSSDWYNPPKICPERDGGWSALLAGRTFPNLECLDLRLDSNAPHHRVTDQTMHAPALRRLITNTLRPVLAPNLRSLSCDGGGGWHWKLVWNFVASFPLLEDIEIGVLEEETFSWIKITEDNRRDTALMLERAAEPTLFELSHLKKFVVDHCGPSAHELLQHLSFPRCAAITVHIYYNEQLWAPVLLRPEFTRPSFKVLSINELYNDVDSIWRLTLTEAEIWFEPSDLPSVQSSISTNLDAYRLLDLVDTMTDAVAAAIKTIAFKYDNDEEHPAREDLEQIEHDSWVSSFGRFSSVTVLHMCYEYRHPLLGPDTASLFPALHTIIITLPGREGPPPEYSWWDDMRGMLAARKATGSPVARLVLRGRALCHFRCPGHEGARTNPRVHLCNLTSDEREHLPVCEERAAVCLQQRRITLEEERQHVGEVVDERFMDDCTCFRECKELYWVLVYGFG